MTSVHTIIYTLHKIAIQSTVQEYQSLIKKVFNLW